MKLLVDKKIIEKGGGHNMAAGFSMKKDKLKDFENFIYYETDPDKNDVVYKRETIQIRLLTPSYIEKKNETKIIFLMLENLPNTLQFI